MRCVAKRAMRGQMQFHGVGGESVHITREHTIGMHALHCLQSWIACNGGCAPPVPLCAALRTGTIARRGGSGHPRTSSAPRRGGERVFSRRRDDQSPRPCPGWRRKKKRGSFCMRVMHRWQVCFRLPARAGMTLKQRTRCVAQRLSTSCNEQLQRRSASARKLPCVRTKSYTGRKIKAIIKIK